MLDFLALAQQCAPTVAPQTMASVVTVESLANPYGIGVVDGYLVRQPANREEAVATAQALADAGWNFSLGAAQVNRYNLPKYNVTYDQAFDPCTSLRVGSKILEDCYVRASKTRPDPQVALQAAISCYYSGNFSRGFKPDKPGSTSYVERVLLAAADPVKTVPIVPELVVGNSAKPIEVRAIEDKPPVKLTKEASGPAGPPSDNAPVLVRRQGVAFVSPEPAEAAPPVAAAPTAAPVPATDPSAPVRLQTVQPETATPPAPNQPETRRSVVLF